jgi:TRAP-type C4-dicarboxylate transport system permease small subunit
MEGGLTMLFHSLIITIILYLVMRYVFKQNYSKAMDRSLVIGAFVLIYMILFGHGLPNKLNPNFK